MSTLEMLNRILDWAETRPKFDTKFVKSVKDKYAIYGKFTESQKCAISNIYIRFRIDMPPDSD